MSPTLDYRGPEKEKKEPLTPRQRHWIYLLVIVAVVIAFVVIYGWLAVHHLGSDWGSG